MKRILFITTMLLSSTVGFAHAADLEYPGDPVSRTVVEYGSGWYLRGDIGYAVETKSTLSYFSDARYDYDNQTLENGSSYGIGFGYNFNDYLRADLTYDTNNSTEWSGTSVGTLCGGGVAQGDCYSEDTASFDRKTLLANAYVSLGEYHGFSPYLGAGIGLSDIKWNDYSSDAYCTVDAGETCTFGAHSGVTADPETYFGGTTTYPGESVTALTYALAAGFDYRLDQNWVLDMGYKYTSVLGGVVIAKDANGAGAPQGDSKFDNINIHEVKVGLRYEIW